MAIICLISSISFVTSTDCMPISIATSLREEAGRMGETLPLPAVATIDYMPTTSAGPKRGVKKGVVRISSLGEATVE